MRDFMAAVVRRRHSLEWIGRSASLKSVNVALQCGPDAVSGACEKSVVQQLSTMPAWLYRGGLCYPYLADKKEYKSDCLPAYPWNTTENFALYQAGTSLVDKTCGQMARYMGRLVSHYTAGGHRDECGHWHPSGFNYSWFGLSSAPSLPLALAVWLS